MLDHVSITASDIAAAERFYDAIMKTLDVVKIGRRDDWLGYSKRARHIRIASISCGIPMATGSRRFAVTPCDGLKSSMTVGLVRAEVCELFPVIAPGDDQADDIHRDQRAVQDRDRQQMQREGVDQEGEIAGKRQQP